MIAPQHLITYFRAHNAVSGAVGTAGGGLPIVGEMNGAIAALMPRRAIVVTASGGPEILGLNHDLAQGRMDVRCYGATLADAWELNDVVYEVLRYNGRRAMNGKTVHAIWPSGGGIQGRDQDVDAPFVFTEYTMIIAEDR